MLSNHDASLRHITWGMSAVAVLTAAGLALTASRSEVANEMAEASSRMSEAKVEQWAALQPRAVPQVPLATEAPLPPAPVVAPAGPVPPALPHVPVHAAQGHALHADMNLPTQASIATMVPDIQIDHRCDGRREATTQDFTDASGKRHVRVLLCEASVHRGAMIEARAEMAQARRAMASARIMSADDRAEALADAQADLAEARAEMARARAEARRDIERDRAEID